MDAASAVLLRDPPAILPRHPPAERAIAHRSVREALLCVSAHFASAYPNAATGFAASIPLLDLLLPPCAGDS